MLWYDWLRPGIPLARQRLESSTLKNRSCFTRRPGIGAAPGTSPRAVRSESSQPAEARPARCSQLLRVLCGAVLIAATLGLTSCHSASYYYYKFPEFNFAGRPIPPSKLAQRVMIAVTANGAVGTLQIVDASRDIRNNVQNTIPGFSITGYASGLPTNIFNFPSELRGYVYSSSDGSLAYVDYSGESSKGTVGTFQAGTDAIAIPTTFAHFYGAESSAGLLEIVSANSSGTPLLLNIPNVFRVAVNKGDTVVLAMVRNSNVLYRIFRLSQSQYPTAQAAIAATGSVDCQPEILPVYCAVQVPGKYDRPYGVYFSLDGATAYVLNCGQECGGTSAGITVLQQGPLNNNVIPSSPVQPDPTVANIAVPGGVTSALSDGTTLYVAGQQLQPDGLFAGFLSTINLATNAVTGKISISDGTHTKMLFADDNTLWIGSQSCATGERAKLGQNYNCLTRVALGSTLSAQVIPDVTPGGSTTVPFPNQNFDPYYYGSLTGLCWIQNLNKIYTAYGGQVHIFRTTDGSEIDNQLVTVAGTALDVAYMDALTDDAN